MADVKFEVVEFTIPTGAATFNVTKAGFGTPKAVIIYSSWAEVSGVLGIDSMMSVGFATASDEVNTIATSSLSGAADVTSGLWSSSGNVVREIRARTSLTPLTRGVLDFVSFIPDGISLLPTTPYPEARLATCILIGGDDVESVYASAVSLGNTTSPVPVTDPGFEPDILFTSATASAPGGASTLYTSYGAAINDAGVTQYSLGYQNPALRATMDVKTEVRNDCIANWATSVAPVVLNSFDSLGFTFQTSSARTSSLYYLAIKLKNNPGVSLDPIQVPTSGALALAGKGFEPNFGLITTAHGPTSYNVAATTANSGTIGLTSFDADSAKSLQIISRGGTASSQERSSYADGLTLYNPLAVLSAQSSGYAFNSDGWEFTLATNPAAPILGFALSIGPGSAPPVGIQEMYIKDGGIFVKYTPYVKVGGAFQEVDAYVLEGGTWKPVHEK